eukprot:5499592-Pyramimonas_sp.AAC.1
MTIWLLSLPQTGRDTSATWFSSVSRASGHAPGKKHCGRPIRMVRDPLGRPAALAAEAADVWLAHFAREELSAVVAADEVQALFSQCAPLPGSLTRNLPVEGASVPALHESQRACNRAKPSAASSD